MITVRELQNSVYGQDDPEDYAALEEFFAGVVERKYGKELKEARETARVTGIYDTILRNYRLKYKIDVPEKLEARIDAINYYPALEEIQAAVWLTASPSEFEREVDSVVEKYAEEIEALNKK